MGSIAVGDKMRVIARNQVTVLAAHSLLHCAVQRLGRGNHVEGVDDQLAVVGEVRVASERLIALQADQGETRQHDQS